MSQILSNELIISVIDKGLTSLGESPKKAIWYYLEKDFKFNREKVSEDLEKFEDVLKKYFGIGYDFLESLFILYLREATGEDLSPYNSFSECISGLRIKHQIIGNQKLSTTELWQRI